jgi:hypothetical protein
MSIEYRQIDALRPDPTNARRHRKKQIRQIANSISTFLLWPVPVDADRDVIAGYGRLLAGRQLGMTEVPTVAVDHLTPEQIRAFRIADNRLTENAAWDDRLLAEQLRDLSLAGLDFDIEVTGFEMAEIDLRIASLGGRIGAGRRPCRYHAGSFGGPPISQPGDEWILGCHRVRCANALEPAAFAAPMGDERAGVVFTDPPFRHELVLFKHGRNGHRNNVQLCQFARSNVWHYPGANSFARSTAESNLLALHPTVKPVAMVADAILDCSARGDIVLDAFLGSGTTVIAAERTGWRGFGLELDPSYVDVTVRRWQTLTGGRTRHAANGHNFDDLAGEAEAANAA